MNLRTLLILGALCAFGPLAIDFYLPSFPVLAQQFATDVEHVQLSLAAYFVGREGQSKPGLSLTPGHLW